MSLYRFALLWLVGTNLLAIVLTVSDKVRAKKGKWRVPEDTLLFVALLGGAVGEYMTMRLIRHKTRHKKFMITLPLFILLQAALALVLEAKYYFY